MHGHIDIEKERGLTRQACARGCAGNSDQDLPGRHVGRGSHVRHLGPHLGQHGHCEFAQFLTEVLWLSADLRVRHCWRDVVDPPTSQDDRSGEESVQRLGYRRRHAQHLLHEPRRVERQGRQRLVLASLPVTPRMTEY